MKWIFVALAVFSVAILIGTSFQSAIVEDVKKETGAPELRASSTRQMTSPFREMKDLVTELMAHTTNMSDNDTDGLPDAVERAIGTDPNDPDSDSDRITDKQEIDLTLDPLNPDSNRDGLADYLEVNNVTADLDGDGTPNTWDQDNDNDGVNDGADLSPTAYSPTTGIMNLSVKTRGDPTYLTMQVTPGNREFLKLMLKRWDWPDGDKKGQIMDLDNSKNDLFITPYLELKTNIDLNQSLLLDYGILADGKTACVPLFPVYELGDIVALNGKMFIPGTGASLDFTADATLKFRVNAYTDKKCDAFVSSYGLYMHTDDNGLVKAIAIKDDAQTQFEVVQQEQYIAFKASNGKYVSVDSDGTLVADSVEIGETCLFTRGETSNHLATFKYKGNGNYLTAYPDGKLKPDADSVSTDQKFIPVDGGVRNDLTTLIAYTSSFRMTGMNIEENHGTDLGIFYSPDVAQMLAANLLLSFDFIRNATNSISDMPGIFTANNVTVQNIQESLAHHDLVAIETNGQTMSDILNSLPPGKVLPVSMVLEDNFSVMELSQIPGTYIKGNKLSVDLRSASVTVSRSLKTPWYDTSGACPVPGDEIVNEIMSWGLDNDSLKSILPLVVAWFDGETEVVYDNGVLVLPYIGEGAWEVSNTVIQLTAVGVSGISFLLNAYVAVRSCQQAVDSIRGWGAVMTCKYFFQTAKDHHELLKLADAGQFGKINRALYVLKIVGYVLLGVIAIYTIIALGCASGWSASGTVYAVATALTSLSWSLILIAFAAIHFYAAVLVGILALIDSILWLCGEETLTDRLIAAVVNGIMSKITRMEERNTVDMEVTEISVELDDPNKNGLDMGDSIIYHQNIKGIVEKTGAGSKQDLVDGYIKPSLYYAYGNEGKTEAAGGYVEGSDKYTSTKKTTMYYCTAVLPIGTETKNLELNIYTKYYYRFYYNDYVWIFFWERCTRESKSGHGYSEPITIYYDVAPQSLDRFLRWKELVLQDNDGDGLINSEETSTSPWRYDSDSDRLSDRYEMFIGTNPNAADTDLDGLNDRRELELGLNATCNDTDCDGLSDRTELSGWVISYEYGNTTVNVLVRSDPRFEDGDGDGLSDPDERLLLLNPMSADTDGDGVSDMYDFTGTEFSYVCTLPEPEGDWAGTHPFIVEMDAEGYIYVGMLNDTEDPPMTTIVKYYPNGTYMCDLGISNFADFKVTLNGTIYVSHDIKNNLLSIWTYGSDGTMISSDMVGFVNNAEKIAIDEKNGYVYVLDFVAAGSGGTVMQFYLSNWTLKASWPETLGGSVPKWGRATVDQYGALYVPEAATTQVIKYDFDNLTRYAYNNSLANTAVQVNLEDEIFISDGTGLHKMYGNWTEIASFGSLGAGNDQFHNITHIKVWKDSIYVADYENNRVQKIRHLGLVPNSNASFDFSDTDGDLLTDTAELAGWTVTVVRPTGTFQYKVTSDVLITDTDNDGLSDRDERIYLADPRSPDTDGDGISDYAEVRGLKTRGPSSNLTVADTDGDGLTDGVEVTWGSDPTTNSTDADGLTDYEEFLLGADPMNNDTDYDGLGDLQEVAFGSSLTSADADEDGAFDGWEFEMGTDPNSNDTDGDGLRDIDESVYGLNPTSSDTDGDGLPDGFEWGNFLNATNNDTDGDGLNDKEELARGLDPFSGDTDGDGKPDLMDDDYLQQMEGEIVLVMDTPAPGFVANLSKTATVISVTPQELMADHSDAQNIVLVGRPDAVNATAGTAGAVMRALLNGSGEELDGMEEGTYTHMAVRYGTWAPTQTVVMLSNIWPYDEAQVLGMLKGTRVTLAASALHAEYLSARSEFRLEGYDAQRTTGSQMRGMLDGNATFNITLTKYVPSDVPNALASWNGLGANEVPMGRYLEVDSDTAVPGAHIEILYTAQDLDRNGDGDANDAGDLNEDQLSLYYCEGGAWNKVTDSLDWVHSVGVNTTDVTLLGADYAGYLWADVSQLYLFGVSGKINMTTVPVVARAGDDVDLFVGETVVMNGSLSTGNGAILNYTWRILGGIDTAFLYGPLVTYTFQDPGNYSAVLEVKDSLGLTAADSVKVTVRELEHWVLAIGPVMDEGGIAVEGAQVVLTIGNATLDNITDVDGYAYFTLGAGDIGLNVSLHIEKDGYEDIDLSTSIGQNRTLEALLPALVKQVPILKWTLTVGPLVDNKGAPVDAATVRLTVGGSTYANTTDAAGITSFLLPNSALDQDVAIAIEKTGYKSINYTTHISANGTLELAPPTLEGTETPAGDTSNWQVFLIIAVLAVLLILIAVFAIVQRRKGKGEPSDDTTEDEEDEGEANEEEQKEGSEDAEEEDEDEDAPTKPEDDEPKDDATEGPDEAVTPPSEEMIKDSDTPDEEGTVEDAPDKPGLDEKAPKEEDAGAHEEKADTEKAPEIAKEESAQPENPALDKGAISGKDMDTEPKTDKYMKSFGAKEKKWNKGKGGKSKKVVKKAGKKR